MLNGGLTNVQTGFGVGICNALGAGIKRIRTQVQANKQRRGLMADSGVVIERLMMRAGRMAFLLAAPPDLYASARKTTISQRKGKLAS